MFTPAALVALAEKFGQLRSATLIPPHDAQALPSARIEYLVATDAAQAVRALTTDHALVHAGRRASVRLELRGAESGTASLRSTKVRLSWFAPSLAAWAHYSTLSTAKKEAERLDGLAFNGRLIRASFQTPSWNQRTSFSVELKGLPLEVPAARVKAFCRASLVTMGRPSFVVGDAVRRLRTLLEGHGALESFDFTPPSAHTGQKQPKPNPKLVAFAQFADPDAAARAVAAMHGKGQAFLRGSPVFVELIHSVKYMLPRPQFAALHADIDALRDALETCRLRYYDTDERGAPTERVCVRAYGRDAKALGRLKRELEQMLRGDVVHDGEGRVAWHEHLATTPGKEFVNTLASDTQTFVRCDDRTRTVHLFGSQVARTAARARILAKLQDLVAEGHIIDLDEQALRRILRGGFDEVQAVLVGLGGEVSFDITRRRLVVHGSDADVRAARAKVTRLLGEVGPTREHDPSATDSDIPCPICFCDVSDPLTLPCGHTYCRSCLQHYLTSLARPAGSGSAGAFAAGCLAEVARDDGTKGPCAHGVPLATIRALLSPGDEERLFDAAFLAYIHGRASEFKYCPSADCPTVYRAGEADTVLRCPTCLERVCAFCHVEAHEGLSCAEYKDRASGGDESFQRWREEHDVRPCPACGTALEKSGGCNHMTCARCGAHMCWVCMKVFDAAAVYGHMSREHGGIGI
ncbi:hypothetical protein C8Q77DRAFT_317706 [Trametes polyzona]|nr:hypothetical protein C8Q77DRAFT_317706 [Trametes polyzona]